MFLVKTFYLFNLDNLGLHFIDFCALQQIKKENKKNFNGNKAGTLFNEQAQFYC